MSTASRIAAGAALACSLLLAACAHSQDEAAAPSALQEKPCGQLYTIAPGNFIVDLAAGSIVSLDPSVRDFELYCSPDEARTAARRSVVEQTLPEEGWRIYRLDGEAEAKRTEGGALLLASRATLADWLE